MPHDYAAVQEGLEERAELVSDPYTLPILTKPMPFTEREESLETEETLP